MILHTLLSIFILIEFLENSVRFKTLQKYKLYLYMKQFSF